MQYLLIALQTHVTTGDGQVGTAGRPFITKEKKTNEKKRKKSMALHAETMHRPNDLCVFIHTPPTVLVKRTSIGVPIDYSKRKRTHKTTSYHSC